MLDISYSNSCEEEDKLSCAGRTALELMLNSTCEDSIPLVVPSTCGGAAGGIHLLVNNKIKVDMISKSVKKTCACKVPHRLSPKLHCDSPPVAVEFLTL